MDNEIKDKIKTFLSRFIRNHDVAYDEDIFASGFINSLFAMQLVMFVEKEFEITVDNEDLEIENFSTIAALASLVERKSQVLASV
jgi:methoxymalonate biosynthesis acyl carrier protein